MGILHQVREILNFTPELVKSQGMLSFNLIISGFCVVDKVMLF